LVVFNVNECLIECFVMLIEIFVVENTIDSQYAYLKLVSKSSDPLLSKYNFTLMY